MNPRQALIAAILSFPVVCGAQEQSVIPLKLEPHHHLVLHNDFVNVYSVQVEAKDSVLLHKHTFDAIGIMLSDAEINTAYRNVTVELLFPQQERRNICASIISGQPLNCPSALSVNAALLEQPQFETNQTKINLIRLKQQQSVTLDASPQSRLVIELDDTAMVTGVSSPPRELRSGDIWWCDSNSPGKFSRIPAAKKSASSPLFFTNEKSAK
jgi:hypothetical protein